MLRKKMIIKRVLMLLSLGLLSLIFLISSVINLKPIMGFSEVFYTNTVEQRDFADDCVLLLLKTMKSKHSVSRTQKYIFKIRNVHKRRKQSLEVILLVAFLYRGLKMTSVLCQWLHVIASSLDLLELILDEIHQTARTKYQRFIWLMRRISIAHCWFNSIRAVVFVHLVENTFSHIAGVQQTSKRYLFCYASVFLLQKIKNKNK